MVSPQPPDFDRSPRIVVVRADRGWEVRQEVEDRIIRVTRHTDWHRVERSVRRFETQKLDKSRRSG